MIHAVSHRFLARARVLFSRRARRERVRATGKTRRHSRRPPGKKTRGLVSVLPPRDGNAPTRTGDAGKPLERDADDSFLIHRNRNAEEVNPNPSPWRSSAPTSTSPSTTSRARCARGPRRATTRPLIDRFDTIRFDLSPADASLPPSVPPRASARTVRHRPQAAMPRARHHPLAVPQGSSPPQSIPPLRFHGRALSGRALSALAKMTIFYHRRTSRPLKLVSPRSIPLR